MKVVEETETAGAARNSIDPFLSCLPQASKQAQIDVTLEEQEQHKQLFVLQ